MNCPNCNSEVKDGMKFCPSCGIVIQQETVCPNCGNTIKDGMRFCPSCGCNFTSLSESPNKQNHSLRTVIINSLSIIVICVFSFYNIKMIYLLFNTSNSEIERYINNIYSDLKSSNPKGCFDIISDADRKYFPEYFVQEIKDDVKEYKKLEQILPNYDRWRGLVKGYNQEFEKAEITAIDNNYFYGHIFFDDSFIHNAWVYILITTHDIKKPVHKNYIQARLGISYKDFKWKVHSITLRNLPNGCYYDVGVASFSLGHFTVEIDY